MTTLTGFIHGTGAEINVEIGYVPDYVRISNLTDGDLVTEGFPMRVIVFTSQSTAINQGDWIKGITSGAKAQIREVIIDSGTIAGGDAAGWLLCHADDVTGTIASENAEVYGEEPTSTAAATNDISVVVDVEFNLAIAAAVAGEATAAAMVTAYAGSSTTSKGFTLGSTLSENGKLLFYMAVKSDRGSDPKVAGVTQHGATVW